MCLQRDEVTENIELMIAKAPEALQPQNTYEDQFGREFPGGSEQQRNRTRI